MDDLISRRAALEALKALEEKPKALEDDYDFGRRQMLETCIDIIQDLQPSPSAQSEQRWIPCSEMLPKEYDVYRITWTTSASKKRFVCDSEYEITGEWDDKRNDFKGEWLLDDYIKTYPDVKVIAWKTIEEPYAERREE